MKHTISILWLRFFIVAGGLTSVFANGAPASEVKPDSITNGAEWENDRPVALPSARRPKVENIFLSRPGTEWTYSHHPHLGFFNGRFYAIWSNGRKSEDKPGQRVMISTSEDFTHWTPPRPLVDTVKDAKGDEEILTAGGLYPHGNTLVAYFQSCGPRKWENRAVQVLTTSDGQNWSAPHDLDLSISPPSNDSQRFASGQFGPSRPHDDIPANHGPQPIASGRLIICGNTSYPWTDDPSGLTGWHMAGIDPPASTGHPCEGAFYQTDDGVIHMLLRNSGVKEIPHRLWLTESRDNGLTWSAPIPTEFSDAHSKFHFGRLPDGRFYYVGNPLWHRTPLVLSLSRDGVHFDQHFILAEARGGLTRDSEGWGVPAYPHSIVHDGYLYVIVSRGKSNIEVLRAALSELADK